MNLLFTMCKPQKLILLITSLFPNQFYIDLFCCTNLVLIALVWG